MKELIKNEIYSSGKIFVDQTNGDLKKKVPLNTSVYTIIRKFN